MIACPLSGAPGCYVELIPTQLDPYRGPDTDRLTLPGDRFGAVISKQRCGEAARRSRAYTRQHGSDSRHTRLGVYEITAQIGEGGMGAVYRATDTSLSRAVAIKVLPDAFAQDAERLARFEREAKTLASLNHPNIAAIHAVEKSGGPLALVMELVEGDDLSQRELDRRVHCRSRSRSRRRWSRARTGDRPSRPQARQHQGAE